MLVVIGLTGCAEMQANPKTSIGALSGGAFGGLIAAAAGGGGAAIAGAVMGGARISVEEYVNARTATGSAGWTRSSGTARRRGSLGQRPAPRSRGSARAVTETARSGQRASRSTRSVVLPRTASMKP
jgi:hypothetical protein